MATHLNSSNQARFNTELSKLKQNILKESYEHFRTSLQSSVHGDVSICIQGEFNCFNKCIVLSVAPELSACISGKSEEESASISIDSIDCTIKNKLAIFFKTDHPPEYEEMFMELEKLYQNNTYSDVVIELSDGKKFNCHRCILAAHSEYFNVMFYSQWRESRQKDIKLTNITSDVFEVFVHYIYSAKVDVPVELDVLDLILAQDLIHMQGFHNAIKLHLKAYYCHYFHSPCESCVVSLTNLYNVVINANILGYNELVESCNKWFVRYYSKVFQNRKFLGIPKPVREIIVTKVKQSIDDVNILPNLKECASLRSLPNVKWALEAAKYVKEIESFCLKYACDKFNTITEKPGFKVCLLEDKNVHTSRLFMEMLECAIKAYLTRQNCLMVYKAAFKLDDMLSASMSQDEGLVKDLEHSREFIDSVLLLAKTSVKKIAFNYSVHKIGKICLNL